MHDMLLIRAALLCSTFVLAGCGLTALQHRRDDNRHVRALQEASLSRFEDRPIAGESVEEFFRNKVGLIAIEGGRLPIGRAVPISFDGYYLTAWHVVSEGEFRLSDMVNPTNGPPSEYRVDEYPGRIVWHDATADLAIVKFEFRPAAVFATAGPPLGKGQAVFSGASGRNSGTRSTMRNSSGIYDFDDLLENSRGNGPFGTAGRITNRRSLDEGFPHMVYESTLVARAGMSGGPVVTSNGRLAGIITRANPKLFTAPTAVFSMIDPKDLKAIISTDRGLLTTGRDRPPGGP